MRHEYEDSKPYSTIMVATRKAEDQHSSNSLSVAKYGKANAKAAQVTGSQGSDWSILKEL